MVFDVKSGSGGRAEYYIVAVIVGSRRFVGCSYHTTHWDVGTYEQGALYASSCRALVAPVELSLETQFAYVALSVGWPWHLSGPAVFAPWGAHCRVQKVHGLTKIHFQTMEVRQSVSVSHGQLMCLILKLARLLRISLSRDVCHLRMGALPNKDVLS